MECCDTKRLIEVWWDRELPPPMAGQVEKHLHECPACRLEYGPVNELLTSPEPLTVPAGLRSRILAAVDPPVVPRASAPRMDPFSRWLRLARSPGVGAVAACLTFFLMGWFSAQFRPTKTIDLPPPSGDVLPNPGLLAGWVQAMTLPGHMGPLTAVAQGAAFDRLTQPPDAAPARWVRGRPLIHDLTPPDSTPAIPELPIIITGLSTLGA